MHFAEISFVESLILIPILHWLVIVYFFVGRNFNPFWCAYTHSQDFINGSINLVTEDNRNVLAQCVFDDFITSKWVAVADCKWMDVLVVWDFFFFSVVLVSC